jgi:hypothetical protein
MGTNCAPPLADLFLYSYESEFLQKLVKDKKIHEARAFYFTYRYFYGYTRKDINTTVCQIWREYDLSLHKSINI